MDRTEAFWGANDIDRMFPRDWDTKEPALRTSVPWKHASRSKNVWDYDQHLVRDALSDQGNQERSAVDPRTLRATQPSVTREGVHYYLGDEYKSTGKTYKDQGNVGNQTPVIYDRDDGQSLILSGHHRAAASLLRGEQFDGIRIAGPWGRER